MPGRYRWFWRGARHGIPPCRTMFFEDGLGGVAPECGDAVHAITGDAGVILRPQCVAGSVPAPEHARTGGARRERRLNDARVWTSPPFKGRTRRHARRTATVGEMTRAA